MNWLTKQKTSQFWPLARHFLKSGWKLVHGLFPLTWVSIVLIALTYYAWFWEVSAHANQILYTVILLWGFAFLLILAFTLLSAVLVFGLTRRANRSENLEIKNEVGGHIKSGYRTFCPFIFPFVTVDIELQEKGIKRRENRQFFWAGEVLTPTERGRYQMLHRRISVRDIFGLTHISFVIKQAVSMEIQPASSRFEMVAFQTRTSGDGYSHPEGDPRGELVEMRRYQAGDPLRLVLWKVFARGRKLVVRAPEPAIVEENDMFVYFISGQNDETSASMARSFLSAFGSDRDDLCFAADGAQRIVSDEKEGISDVIDSVSHKEHAGEDLLAVAPLVTSGAMAHCFLLVPPQLGKWFDFVEKFITFYHVSPIFIVSVDGAKEQKKAVKAGRLRSLFCTTDEVVDDNARFNELCEKLNRLGTVRIVDVTTGASQDYKGGAQ